eukprot:scaffold182889_cov31-Tisochrysis_lutea.AAC.1
MEDEGQSERENGENEVEKQCEAPAPEADAVQPSDAHEQSHSSVDHPEDGKEGEDTPAGTAGVQAGEAAEEPGVTVGESAPNVADSPLPELNAHFREEEDLASAKDDFTAGHAEGAELSTQDMEGMDTVSGDGEVKADEGGEIQRALSGEEDNPDHPDTDEQFHKRADAASKIAAIRRGQLSRRGLLPFSEPELVPMGDVDGNGGEEDEQEERKEVEDEDEDEDEEREEEIEEFNEDEAYLEAADAVDEIAVYAEEDEEAARLTELWNVAQDRKALLVESNQALQRKLGEYLRTVKKHDERAETEAAVVDQEARYTKTLGQVVELREEFHRLQKTYNSLVSEIQQRLDEKEAKAREIRDAFLAFKREIFKGSENSRTGKPISAKLVAQFEEQEALKDIEIEKMHLTNIQRRNTVRKLEQSLKQKENLAEGLHLIDFEQLKIENQTLNEKIEERNEELLKLRKKTTSTVQVLTHFKEKLQFVQADNQLLKHELADLELELTNKRDVLTQLKHERDALRAESSTRKKSHTLVSSEELLIDFEKRRQHIVEQKKELERLKQRHASLLGKTSETKSAA